ncbi:unnamed protein product [Didymodactylos carnosus]|uniref:Reverse transcriptase domain-containing protein n=1 Tax=Didymodactylos carnosus TaxID=1234261 RepID=A0A8S2DC55_9BILA|nr:unnamed protein product [Didymodactylos carnosus]CAF3705388.1 unnamed protein product [Didymodactylos carnosus]
MVPKILKFLSSHKLISKNQSGHLPRHSTTAQLVEIVHRIAKGFTKNEPTMAAFIDFSKAFDKVPIEGSYSGSYRAFQDASNVKGIFDLNYQNLFNNPILSVQQIYKYFNYEYTEEFHQNMLKWLMQNPQGKQGRNNYGLEQFGFTAQEVDKHYRKYTDMFL